MKILIAYDGSMHADIAIDDLQWAGLPQNAQALVLSAVEWPKHAPRSWGMVETGYRHEWTVRIAEAEQSAESACHRIQTRFPQWDVQLEAPTGSVAEVILEKANAWPADLIVAGTHGRSGLGRALLGSVSSKLVRESSCSVRVARLRTQEGPIRLLIGNDGSAEAGTVIDKVCSRSWPAGTEARILAVHEVLVAANVERIALGPGLYDKTNEDEHFRLLQVVRESAEKLRCAGLTVSPMVEAGDPKDVLLQEARNWNADTLFIGARGLGRVERFLLGSVSSAAVAHAPCSVEVVRQ